MMYNGRTIAPTKNETNSAKKLWTALRGSWCIDGSVSGSARTNVATIEKMLEKLRFGNVDAEAENPPSVTQIDKEHLTMKRWA
jgi:hypothetical protein